MTEYYKQKVRRNKRVTSIERVHNSMNCEEYMASVTSYISKYIDDMKVSETSNTRSQKLWMLERCVCFVVGDKVTLRTEMDMF